MALYLQDCTAGGSRTAGRVRDSDIRCFTLKIEQITVQLRSLDGLDDHGLVFGDGVVDHGGALVGSHHRRTEYVMKDDHR